MLYLIINLKGQPAVLFLKYTSAFLVKRFGELAQKMPFTKKIIDLLKQIAGSFLPYNCFHLSLAVEKE